MNIFQELAVQCEQLEAAVCAVEDHEGKNNCYHEVHRNAKERHVVHSDRAFSNACYHITDDFAKF